MKKLIRLTVNDQEHELAVWPHRTLLQVLREDLELTGAKHGCGLGECGACTVVVDGVPMNACLILAVQVNGARILTIEGLAKDGQLHPLQSAFVEHGAIQCGFCTPGMILSAKALLEENSRPDEREIRKAISGNLCRCTGYQKIVEAVEAASSKMSVP